MSSLKFNPLSFETCLKPLSSRSKNSHKGNFGHVLIIGGDYGFEGSVRLAGEAALRSGAGLVSIATRKEHAFAIAGNCPELMCHGVQDPSDLDELIEKATVIILGPGLGTKTWGQTLWQYIIQKGSQNFTPHSERMNELTVKAQRNLLNIPLIIDADGLNLLSKEVFDTQSFENVNAQMNANMIENMRSYSKNWILTPHPGEAARLLNQTIDDIQQDRIAAIYQLQKKYSATVVLKGSETLIWDGGDEQPSACLAGNPVLSTAGTGDVLTGVMAALIAEGLSKTEAVNLSVMVHAMAGDQIAKTYGEIGMKASDLFPYIRELLNSNNIKKTV